MSQKHRQTKSYKLEVGRIFPMLWVAIADSLGWGIAFSAAAALILDPSSHFLSDSLSMTSRYMVYESLLAVYSVFTFLFSPVIGGISDHYGRKPALKMSMFGLTLGFILCTFACVYGSLVLLFIGRILSGMMAGSVSVAQAAVIDISTRESKASYLSLMTFSNCAGMSLGPVIGGFLVHWSTGPLGAVTFASATLISFIGLLLVTYRYRETHTDRSREKLKLYQGFLNIYYAFQRPTVNLFLLIFLFSMTAYGLCFSNIPLFLHSEYDSASYTTGLVLGMFGLCLTISLAFSGKYIFARFSVWRIVLVTQVLQLIVYVVLSFSIHHFYANLVLFAWIAITLAQLYVGLLTIISNVTHQDWQGRIMGVVSSLFAIPWAVGPMLAAGFSHINGGAAFGVSALLTIFSLWCFVSVGRNELVVCE